MCDRQDLLKGRFFEWLHPIGPKRAEITAMGGNKNE